MQLLLASIKIRVQFELGRQHEVPAQTHPMLPGLDLPVLIAHLSELCCRCLPCTSGNAAQHACQTNVGFAGPEA